MSTPHNNFAPPQSAVADIPAEDLSSRKASRGSRLAAIIIDGLIFGIPFIASFWVGLGAMRPHPTPLDFWMAAVATGAVFWAGACVALALVVLTTMLVYQNGQTIGKRLLGIKVVRTDGSRASLSRIFFLRYLLNTLFMWVPLAGGLYALVDPLMIFGEARRCCHDYLADTIVIWA
jgi:uncharacterized RDD family membrane protein YckC